MGRPRKKTTNQVDAPAGSNELDVRWVMSNLSANPDQKLAPSPAAWEMYKIASVDEKSKSDFMKSVYAVVVRKEKPPEIGKTMSDDNRKFMRLFDLLEAEKPELLNEQFPRNALAVL